MAKKSAIKTAREPLFHVVKRDDLTGWKAWSIRIATIVISFFIVGILSVIVTGQGFGETYETMFSGVFGRLFKGSTTMLWKYLQEIAILLSLALALTPAFKMKFWNCGAEGQAGIKLAIEKIFGVKVASVNTVSCKGKLKRMGRHEGYTPDRKKAIVQLKEDSKTIEFFDSLT